MEGILMESPAQLLTDIKNGRHHSIARGLTLVENSLPGSSELLRALEINRQVPVIGITGPPGAGKSTLVNAILKCLRKKNKRIAILAVDPTSPFNFGSLLGDRVRMSGHYNDPDIFIRSVAARGALGGLSAKIMEMCDLLRSGNFDYILVETVGVGQSEVEIAALADITVVVLVPEAGDEIQHIKSGLMEIGDVFVVNKSDRNGAITFAAKLRDMLHYRPVGVPVFQTTADRLAGVDGLVKWLMSVQLPLEEKQVSAYAEKAYKLIQARRMADVSILNLQKQIADSFSMPGFNIYKFIDNY